MKEKVDVNTVLYYYYSMIKDTEKVPECSILEEFGLLDIDRETAKAATKAATKKLNLRETQLEIGLVIN